MVNTINDETEEINRSSSENNLISTSTEEYITETTQSISLKTELKKIPKSIKQPPSISISQSNSVTEDATNVSIDKREVESSGTIKTFFSWNIPIPFFLKYITKFKILQFKRN